MMIMTQSAFNSSLSKRSIFEKNHIELSSIEESYELNFSHSMFNNINAKDVDLRHSDFTNSSIINCNFEGADLRHSNFSVAESFYSIKDTNFKFADFRNTNLISRTFTNCDFSGADFTDANFEYVIFDNCNLQNTVFSISNEEA